MRRTKGRRTRDYRTGGPKEGQRPKRCTAEEFFDGNAQTIWRKHEKKKPSANISWQTVQTYVNMLKSLRTKATSTFSEQKWNSPFIAGSQNWGGDGRVYRQFCSIQSIAALTANKMLLWYRWGEITIFKRARMWPQGKQQLVDAGHPPSTVTCR